MTWQEETPQMDSFELPDDLVQFLASGQQLEYDPTTCEAGQVRLHGLSELRTRTFGAHCGGTPFETDDPDLGGVYRVPGVDLVAACTGDYKPEGLLIWFPGERSFGVWDSSHDYVLVFGSVVSWSDIAKNPARFINAQWGFEDIDRAPAEFLQPWKNYPRV
jgi:hypothetical protein